MSDTAITPVRADAAIPFEKLTIETDGTAKGTKILLNGKEIADLDVLEFRFTKSSWSKDGGYVAIEYTTTDPKYTPGTLQQSTRHRLCPPSPDDAQASAHASIQSSDAAARREHFAQLFGLNARKNSHL